MKTMTIHSGDAMSEAKDIDTYDFEVFEDNVEVCKDDQCIDVPVTIHPKITASVINRVDELTGGRVIYSAEDRVFVGRKSVHNKYIDMAHRINRVVRIAARYLARRAAEQQYRDEGRVGACFTVTIDLDYIDSDLKYEMWLARRAYLRSIYKNAVKDIQLLVKKPFEVEAAMCRYIEELSSETDLDHAILMLMKKLMKIIDEDRALKLIQKS